MASCAEEAMGERSSAARDGSTRQPPQAGPAQAAEDSQCPICLGDIKKEAYVAYCMHCFCFACIQRWTRQSHVCPVCRQPLEQLLHSVRGDNDYEEHLLSLPNRLRRRMAMERACSQSPQRCCSLGKQPTNNHPWADRRGPAGTDSAQRQGVAQGSFNATPHQAPTASAFREPTPLGAFWGPTPPSSSWEPTMANADRNVYKSIRQRWCAHAVQNLARPLHQTHPRELHDLAPGDDGQHLTARWPNRSASSFIQVQTPNWSPKDNRG